MLEDPFYDFDCFQYDSLETTLDKNVQLLQARLQELHAKGYRRAMLVTHSTGGILALRLLTRISLKDGRLTTSAETSPLQTNDGAGIRIRSIHAWATPINGLRSWVSFVGRVPRVLFSPETLPDLKANSAYLKNLKTELSQLAKLMNSVPAEDRARLYVPIVFYQGQMEDGIVHNIDRAADIAAGWWPYEAKIVDTESGHTHNIARGGTLGTPRYPAKLMEINALLQLDLMPRLGDVFPMSAPVNALLERRQLVVVDGISHYARHEFLKAHQPLAGFMKRVVADSFPRSQVVDERIMVRFARSIEDATVGDKMTTDMAAFCDRLVSEIFAGYQTGARVDLSRFGEGRSTVAQTIVEMLRKLLIRVEELVQREKAESVALPYSGSFINFRANVVAIQSRVLASRFDNARTDALASIASTLPQLTAEEITKAELPERMNAFALQNTPRLGPQERDLTAKIYQNLLGRDATVSDPTLRFLNQPMRWLNEDRPRWTALLTNEGVEQLLKDGALPDGPQKFEFITGIIKQTGVTGNALPATRQAVDEAKRMLEGAPGGETKQLWQKQLLDAGRASKYPAIRQDIQRFGRELQ